ncbi:MAG: hypothetical protein K8F30_10360, partial [Taibaiella sp.]|nr:hypothetical protein [Taibaiella sp.]
MKENMQLKKAVPYISVHTILAIVYFFAYKAIKQAYSIPHITWDSNYYARAAFYHDFRLRPSGYPFFLRQLGNFAPSINAVANAQFIIHFCSCIMLLYCVNRIFRLNIILYTALGLAMVLEPVALYHSNSILSDQLFSSLTMLAMATLLLYTNTRKYPWLLLHVCLVFTCIEVRHIALFYPFFSCFILLLVSKQWKVTAINIVMILAVFFVLYKWHIKDNTRKYSSPVYSPFSGWTMANNALYCLHKANVNPVDIKDQEMRSIYQYMRHSLDSTGLVNQTIGSEYLWNEKSPLNILRNKTIDSLYPYFGYDTSWHVSWYVLAPRFGQFGKHFQQHYPFAYLKGYVLPNIQSLM